MTGTCVDFVHGRILNLNKKDKELRLKALKQNSAGSCVRESESIDHLTAYFLSQILTLVCMTHEVETGAVDAYFESEKDDT